MSKFLESQSVKRPPFAPPFLKAGKLVIGQTANILFFLGPALHLAPKDEAAHLWAHQLQLTITDWVAEIHDTHHPIASSLYYEEQKREAKRRAEIFRVERQQKFLNYFEQVLERNGGRVLVGTAVSYVDLSLFQMIEGLRYAWPHAMARQERKHPRLIALHDPIASRLRLAPILRPSGGCPLIRKGSSATMLSSMIGPEEDANKNDIMAPNRRRALYRDRRRPNRARWRGPARARH